MYRATTTDIPTHRSFLGMVASCAFWAVVLMLATLAAAAKAADGGSLVLERMLFIPFAFFGLIALCGALLLRIAPRPTQHGTIHRGRIESKLGDGFPLEVVGGRLHAKPFVVRLDDGRAALVTSSSLVLEAYEVDAQVDVDARIELIGEPTWTADAPLGVYRESTMLCFEGQPKAPIRIRLAATRVDQNR